MTHPKIPSASDIKSAAQAAVETAHEVATAAMRIPPASAQLAAQMPDLVENLAVATERLNTAVDRAERYMALADPMLRAMDRLLPQVEALIETGDDVFQTMSGLPGVGTLSRLAGFSSQENEPDNSAREMGGKTKSRSSPPGSRSLRRK